MTKNNRRYAAYPKQRDLAQVFVRWSLDHLAEDGVCGYNISDAWFRFKLADGAKETRLIIHTKLLEVQQDSEITNYSKGGGGDIGTMILCFGDVNTTEFFVGDHKIDSRRVIESDALYVEVERPWHVKRQTATLHEHRHCINRFNIAIANRWNEFLCADEEIGQWYIMLKKRFTNKTALNFKMVRTSDPKQFLDKHCCGQPKYTEVDKSVGLWLIGFLNSPVGYEVVLNSLQNKLPGNFEASTRAWQQIDTPDFDHYKQDRPAKFEAYMDWIETNMRDKDTFLAGIDEQFEALIG